MYSNFEVGGLVRHVFTSELVQVLLNIECETEKELLLCNKLLNKNVMTVKAIKSF